MTLLFCSMKRVLLSAVILCFLGAVSYAADPVTQVTVIKTDNAAAYIEQLKVGNALLTSLGSNGKLRAWNATIAGPGSGTIGVGVEWPDMASFAADSEKIANSDEWAAWLDGLSSIRSIVSVSLYTEINLE